MAPARPLDLEGVAHWLVDRGMRGLPLAEQLEAYCRRIYEAGFPMRRAQLGMNTLHPRYGSHTFVWRPGAGAIEHKPRDREVLGQDTYLRSPVHHMRSRGILTLRQRLDIAGEHSFPVFSELRAEGLTDYAARVVPYDPAQAADIARGSAASTDGGGAGQTIDGIFFSCATDQPEGFDEDHLGQITATLPFLALAVKSRLTYDVASTVLETYLGRDAGYRVLIGAIARGSAETIRAAIWFSDLRGFTALADTLPRDALVRTLDDYLEAMARPVHDNHGQVLKFMGDGLLAVFDLTGRDETAVCRDALHAAADLRRSFPDLNDQRQAAGKPVMGFGLALHLGEVLYGNIGASDRLDFTVVGPAVNEASRIQALCRSLDRTVLTSSAFRQTAGSPDTLTPLGFHALRGVREPQELLALES